MYTEAHIYIPDQETFEKNQSGQLTEEQKQHFCKLEDFLIEIHQTNEKFIYYPNERHYTFEKAHINYELSIDPLLGYDAKLLPGIEYQLNSLKITDLYDVFPSAKAINAPSKDIVYQTMVSDLANCFQFSLEDLTFNKKYQLSPNQKKKYRQKKRKYDSEPDVGIYEFIFSGSNTFETISNHVPFLQKIEEHLTDLESVFFLYVKYKIYYEKTKNRFLSIEPIEISEQINKYTFVEISPSNSVPHVYKEEKTLESLLIKVFLKIVAVIFFLIPLVFISAGILIPFSVEHSACLSIGFIGFGGWFLYRLIKAWNKINKEKRYK